MTHYYEYVTGVVMYLVFVSIAIAVFVLGPLFFVHNVQAYSASDYNPQYTPYNFEEAADARLCRDSVKAFDSDYDALTKSYTENLTEVILNSGVQGSLNNVTAWLDANEFYYSNVFRDCIAENIKAEEAEAKKRAQERFEREQQAKLQKALEDCDMDYLENMSDSEKMATYDKRMACKDKLEEEAIQESQSEPAPDTTPVYVPPVTTTVPEPVIHTAPAAPQQVDSSPLRQEDQGIDSSTELTEEVQATSSASTTEEKLIEVTEEEIQRIVDQRVNDALKEAQTEVVPEPEKPTFFRKVVNFLFGWF